MYSLSSQPSEANPGFLAKKETEQASQGQTNFKDAKSSELQNIHELQSLIEESSFDLLIRNSNTSNHDTTANLSFLLWEKYIDAVRCDTACTDALSQNEVKDGDFSMRFDIKTKGEKPTEGYPLYIALHGGGGCSASTNDSQWEHMKIYYYDSMDIGIYVAPRGITNNWNLHFEDASYRLYDKLIKYLIACHDVDPNRVYLLGFSAGGDGVYQVVPRMADLWAGANMSAGHSNGVKFDNLYQTPFLIQMGECDKAYNRHKVAAENSLELRRLQKARGGYEHEIFLHCEGTHNNWSDRDASGKARPIVTNIEEWLTEAESEVSHCNTAAVHWLKKYKRNPHPTKLVWDPNTNAPRHVKNGAVYLNDEDTKASLVVPSHLFYWLNIGHNPNLNENFVIEAALDASSNTIELKSLGSLDYISVLLNNKMLDLERPIRVIVDEKDIGSAIVKADLKTMARTLLERGDIHYMFSSEIVITKGDDGIWKILQD